MTVAMRQLIVVLVLACVAGIALPGKQVWAQARDVATIDGVRAGKHAGYTRVVVDLDRKLEYRIFLLKNPYRVVIDLPEVEWRQAQQNKSVGVLKAYRFGLFRPGTSRIVLDLNNPAIVKKSFLLPPGSGKGHRLVIDLSPSDVNAFDIAMQKAPPPRAPVVKEPELPAAIAERNNARKVIVIDAGHGGVDPGAIGKSGIYEKNITLAVAKRLRDALKKTGRYDVRMTRDRDFFVRLRERVAIGRRHGGDLFISLHADSIANPKVRGATVYTLSETASDKEAATLASRENRSDIIAGVDLETESDDVSNILIDLAQRETMNLSAEFAGALVPSMKRAVTMRKNSHRFAGFAVLKAPDVPSVLVELGYLSNRADEAFLKSKKGQIRIATALAGAVDKYFTDK